MTKIPLGISSCLLGHKVRYDGGHKLDAYITGTLGKFFDFRPFCPEMEIGLGAPRPPVRLAIIGNQMRCVGIEDSGCDITESLRGLAERQKNLHAELCGYILKKDSPSCGMEGVKVYCDNLPCRDGSGIYAEEMMRSNPLLPVEEEGRLVDPVLRGNFIRRVCVLYRWQTLLAGGLTVQSLQRFHARHKLVIMSHGDYCELGRLQASLSADNLEAASGQYIALLMQTLKRLATRGNHVNVLQHVQGYLKKTLSSGDRAELGESIEQYRRGEVPLLVPLTLLKHHFRKAPDPYIEESYYLAPFPQELWLINEL